MSRNKDIYVPKDSNYNVAKQLIEEEYYLDAIKILQKIQKKESSSQSLKFALALAWVTSGVSIDRAEKYFRKIIKDDGVIAPVARVELGRILLCKKEYEEARENFEKATDSKKTKFYALSELLYLCIREEKYEEAKKIYDYLKRNGYWGATRNSQIETYIGYKLGKFRDPRSFENYYFGIQLLDYSDERTIEHLKLHLDEDDDKPIHSTYLDSVDIDEVYNSSKIRITGINPSSISIVDKYILSFDKPIGIINQEETDAVSVVTFPNTCDILSMYPVYNYKTRVKNHS